jgi:hypothetical protein
MKDDLKEELTRRRSNEGFKRPVSEERANPTTKKVDEVAPEAAPCGATPASLLGRHQRVRDRRPTPRYRQDRRAWKFFTDNEDKVPDGVKDPNWLWSHHQRPDPVWFGLIALVVVFIVYFNSRSALHKIVDDIKTGVRK